VKCLDATLNDLEALGVMHNNALNVNVA